MKWFRWLMDRDRAVLREYALRDDDREVLEMLYERTPIPATDDVLSAARGKPCHSALSRLTRLGYVIHVPSIGYMINMDGLRALADEYERRENAKARP
jgi:hypothetical protein